MSVLDFQIAQVHKAVTLMNNADTLELPLHP